MFRIVALSYSVKKWLILGRSTGVHLSRPRHFFHECDRALDCDRFSDSFLITQSESNEKDNLEKNEKPLRQNGAERFLCSRDEDIKREPFFNVADRPFQFSRILNWYEPVILHA